MRHGNRQRALFGLDQTGSDFARDDPDLEQVDSETAEPENTEKWSSGATFILLLVAGGLAWAAIITALFYAPRLGD
jgi:hypothetical protein